MDEKTVDNIFAGQLTDLPPVSSKIVRIFTSSTFTDMLMERNTLMEYVYPKIKEYCREKHGLEFQVCVNNNLSYNLVFDKIMYTITNSSLVIIFLVSHYQSHNQQVANHTLSIHH